MAAQSNIGGALCESSVIRFCTTPQRLAEAHCRAVTLPIYENAGLGRKVNFARSRIPSGAKAPKKRTYSVPAQETVKDRAKFGWPPVSDVAAVKTRRKTG